MGTRGLYGLIVDHKVKTSYNHLDSYIAGLGLDILDASRRIIGDFDNYRKRAQKMELVSGDNPPTRKQIAQLERFHNSNVNTGKKEEWYALTRDLQGDLLGNLDVGVMVDGNDFAADGIFCEWGWIVNFDYHTLECYRGFVKAPNKPSGRFADLPPMYPDYMPIHLLGTFPLKGLPSDMVFEDKVIEWYKESEVLFGEESE